MVLLRLLVLAALLGALPARAQEAAAQDMTFFSIGSGEVTGTYYAAVEALCQAVNRAGSPALRCSAEATQGSGHNLIALRNHQIDFAIVQSDWERYAYNGQLLFAHTGAMRDLRAVMALYPETLTVVAVRGRGIATLPDLKGRKIDIGSPSSGRRATAISVLQAAGMTLDDFPVVMELPLSGTYDALCAGRIDAALIVMGHPNAGLGGMLGRCALDLVGIDAALRQQILAASPDLRPAEIRAATYAGRDTPVETLAVTATLVTRADVPDAMVAAVVRDTIDALPRLRLEVPSLATLTPPKMARVGEVAPVHPAAAAIYAAPR